MKITILDRYLLMRLVAALARTILALTALYILIDLLIERIERIDRHNVPWRVVFQYYGALFPHILARYVAPFATLVAGLFVLGEAAQNNEVTAALAGGVSLRRFVRMPILAGLAFSCAVLGMQETLGVAGARKAGSIEGKFFSGGADMKRSPVTWAELTGGWTCHILKFNRVALTGEGVLLYKQQADAQYLIEAHRIFWDETRDAWLLERGWRREFDPVSNARISFRIAQAPAPFPESPDQLFSLDQPPETKTIRALARDIAYAREREMYVAPLEVKYHTRFSQPMLSFVMMILAVPFAMRLRRGGLLISFGTAIAAAVAYLLLFFFAAGLGQMGRVTPWLAAWLASGVFLAVGLVLFAKTPT